MLITVVMHRLLLYVDNLPGCRVRGCVNEDRLRDCRHLSQNVVFVALRFGKAIRPLQVRGHTYVFILLLIENF